MFMTAKHSQFPRFNRVLIYISSFLKLLLINYIVFYVADALFWLKCFHPKDRLICFFYRNIHEFKKSVTRFIILRIDPVRIRIIYN